jgi:WD40-like Beta Propeller Repeat
MQSRVIIRSCPGFLATLLLAACGGGGGGAASSAAPAPTVTLTSSASSIVSGSSVTLTWSSANATSCTASGGWAGTKATSGSELVGPLNANASYGLRCSGAGGTANQTASVNVTAPAGLHITSGAPPNGTVGVYYNHGTGATCAPSGTHCYPCFPGASTRSCGSNWVYQGSFRFGAAGGMPPYTWTAVGVPPGLSVSADGTFLFSQSCCSPQLAGTYTVVVTVTDSGSPAGQVSATYEILINPAALTLSASAVASGADDRIAYTRLLEGGGAEIVTVNPDGSEEEIVPLQDAVEDFGVAVWSPDHSHLLIAPTIRFDGNGDILPFRSAIVRPDGSDYRLLAVEDGPFDAGCSAWSADASRLYCGFGGDQPGVFSIRSSDGGDAHRLTTVPFAGGSDLPTDVSPDGSQILILRKRPGPAPDAQPFRPELFALYVINSDGTNLHQIVPYGVTQGHEIGSAHWSPDGRSIIASNTHGRLFTVSPDGKAIHYLKLGVVGVPFMPNWSPDGSRIVFTMYGPDQEGLFTANADGSDVRQVTDTPDFELGPDWR